MKKLEYKTEISATTEKVWNTLWNAESYEKWSSGNRFEGNWEQGTVMKFFDTQNNGMFNLVETNVLQKELKMKHLGWIMNGELSPQGWEESNISYLLHPIENGTELKVSVNSLDEFVDFYNGYVPKIFEKIKDLAEN